MDYEQVYYVTDDERNARPGFMDHRRPRPGSTAVIRPAVISSAPPAGSTPAYIPPPAPQVYPPVVGINPHAPYWPTGLGYPTQPPYIAPSMVPPSNLASILGGFGNVGSLASIIAQVFAALLPLPAAPPTLDNNSDSDSATQAAINSTNLIKYQSALALFARRDQQILTLGSVLKELLKRPGLVMA